MKKDFPRISINISREEAKDFYKSYELEYKYSEKNIYGEESHCVKHLNTRDRMFGLHSLPKMVPSQFH